MLLAYGAAFGQTSRGTVAGNVTDPTGAVVASATVKLVEKATNVTRQTTTNTAGLYRFDSVLLGDYTITITAQGFAEKRGELTVVAERTTAFDIQMTVGSSVESVTVEANAAQLQTEEPVRGATIDARQLANLPIVNQNSLNLMLIVPGVIKSNQGGSLDSGIGSVNGSRARSNNFMIDGANNNDISVAGPAFVLTNNDAIQEVSIQTSNFTAEFGRSGGAVINQITKSGSNTLHGTVAEVYRSEVLNASSPAQRNSFFSSTTPSTLKPKFKENIPAFTIGGPVIIPGLYNGKDKTFFFAAGQWDRFSSGGAQQSFTIPTDAGIAVLQPLAATCPNVARYLSILGSERGGGGSKIAIDLPAGLASTSCGGGARAGQGVFVGTFTRTVPQLALDNNHQIRLDHNISNKQNMTFRWLYDDQVQTAQNIGLIPAFDSNFQGRTMSAVVTDTYLINNSFTNEFRFSYERFNYTFPLADTKGIGNTLPETAVTGISNIGVSATFPQGRVANSYQYQDTMSRVVGKHTFRYGGEILRQLAVQVAPFNGRGQLTYNQSTANAFTGGQITPLANFIDDFSGPAGNGFAAILFGSGKYRPNLFTYTLFFQDTWKLTPNLTLDAGLRYENFGQPANGFKFPAFTGFTDADATSTAKVNQDNNNFGPTVGFAYSPHWDKLSWLTGNGKSVIRGGFQTSYDTFYNNLLSNMAGASPNALTNVVIPGVSTATTPRGVGNASNVLATAVPTAITPVTTINSVFGKNIRNPYTDRYSLGVQRELPANLVLDLSYVGGVSRQLFYTSQVNPALPNATNTAAGARLFPNRGVIQTRNSGLNANYNAMQFQVRRGFANTPYGLGRIGFTSSYTWSRNMDILSETFATNSGLQNPSVSPANHNLRLFDYGPSDNDRRNVWVTAMAWQLPGPKSGILGQTLGGWEVDHIFTLQSGTPYSPANGIDRDFDGTNIGDRPDIGNINAPIFTRATQVPVATCATGLRNNDTLACVTANDVHWIGVNGGVQPSANTARRNSVHTAGFTNVDMNILKTFKLTERYRFEYRAEIFDILNIRNFNVVPGSTGVPGTTKNVGAGAPNQFINLGLQNMSAGNRTMRMGIKLTF